VLEGEPLVLVHDGEVIERNLRRERIIHGRGASATGRIARADPRGDDRDNGSVSIIPVGSQ